MLETYYTLYTDQVEDEITETPIFKSDDYITSSTIIACCDKLFDSVHIVAYVVTSFVIQN